MVVSPFFPNVLVQEARLVATGTAVAERGYDCSFNVAFGPSAEPLGRGRFVSLVPAGKKSAGGSVAWLIASGCAGVVI